MREITIPVFLALTLLGGCGDITGGNVVVKGTGSEEFLKLRAGPGLGYKVLLGLPEGTELTRHSCMTEVGQLWCKVSPAGAPGLTGYVSADYLSEP